VKLTKAGGSRFFSSLSHCKRVGTYCSCRKHASEDLQPYTCYLAECPQSHPFFNTFDAWEAHVLTEDHQLFEGWTCLFCEFSSKPDEESIFLHHIKDNHVGAIAEESLPDFANMCRRYTTPALDRCPVCSTDKDNWKVAKERNRQFDRGVMSFLAHIGQCMHDFALRVLPETKPAKTEDKSCQNLTNSSTFEGRSLPSCYLHLSHHEKDGLKNSDLQMLPGFAPLDQFDQVQTILTWKNLVENMADANSLDETIRLDPRYDIRKYEKLIERKKDASIHIADPDDEEFPFKWTTLEQPLEFKILDAIVESTFDGRTRHYLPEGLIVEMVTGGSIREELRLEHPGESITRKFDQSRQAELVDWILQGARKLFAICIQCDIRHQNNLLAALIQFKKHGFDDGSLPIRNPWRNNRAGVSTSRDPVFSRQIWSQTRHGDFYDNQWQFLAPVFGLNQYDFYLAPECILPFRMVANETEAGAFSSVYMVEIHPNHISSKYSEMVSQILSILSSL